MGSAGDVAFKALEDFPPPKAATSVRAMKSVLIASVAVFALACGGSTPPAASPSETTGAEQGKEHGEHHGKGKHEDHGNMTPALKDFHHVLAPVWHSPEGKERQDKTCGNLADLKAKAAATADAELVTDVAAVETACAGADKKDVETKLATVHDRFHALAKAASGK